MNDNNMTLPPKLTGALDLIVPSPKKLDNDESVKVSCCCLPFASVKLSSQVKEAMKTEKEQFDLFIETVNKGLVATSSRGQVGVANKQLPLMLKKYEELEKRSKNVIAHYKQEDRVDRCFGSFFCSSNDIKAAQERANYITSHFAQLKNLELDLEDIKKKLLEGKNKLEDLSRTLPEKLDETIWKLSLTQLKTSTISLMEATVKVEEEQIAGEEKETGEGEGLEVERAKGSLEQLLAKINEMLDQRQEQDTIASVAKAFSDSKTLIPKELANVRDYGLLQPLKFCSKEAYNYIVGALNNYIVQRGYSNEIISELDPTGKFVEVSINQWGKGVTVTSLAKLKLTSNDNRVVGTIDATLQAEIELGKDAKLTCTFDGIEVTAATRLSDMENMRVIFSK